MLSKITLIIDEMVISKARNYTRAHCTGISKIVEKYLTDIVAIEDTFDDYGDITKQLMSGTPFTLNFL